MEIAPAAGRAVRWGDAVALEFLERSAFSEKEVDRSAKIALIFLKKINTSCHQTVHSISENALVLLFTSLLTIPLPRQCFLDATLLTGFQVVGVTFDFLDDVFLLNLPLKPAERILKRLAFLHTNLCQSRYTPQPA
jgi:hypothetical protein